MEAKATCRILTLGHNGHRVHSSLQDLNIVYILCHSLSVVEGQGGHDTMRGTMFQ